MKEGNATLQVVLAVLMIGTAFAPMLAVGHDGPHVEVMDDDKIPWPMFAKDRANSGHQSGVSKGVMDPYKVWDRGLILDCWGSTIGDFTDNIELQDGATYDRPAPHGVFSQGNVLQIVEGTTGTVMWSVSIGVNIQAASGLTDTDADGKVEVVVATIDGNVSLFEPTIKWNGTAYNYTQTTAQADRQWTRVLGEVVGYSSITLGDISKDGIDDIVLSTQLQVHALNGTSGAWLWNYSVNGAFTGTPVIVDFGVSSKRVAVSAYNFTNNKLHVYMISSTGQNLNNISISTSLMPFQPIIIPPSVAAGDIDDDNSQEIIVLSPFETGGAKVRAFELDLTQTWTSPFQVTGQFSASPAVGDLDGDGDDDIVVVSESAPFTPRAHILGIEGSLGTRLWNLTINDVRAVASPILGDLDGDGRPDAIVPLYDGVVQVLNGTNGNKLWTLSTQHVGIASSPALGDMTGNGITDILLDGMVIGHRIIDLSLVDGDITFSDSSPEEDDLIHISALVYNFGTKDADDAKVKFIDNYDGKSTTIGFDTLNVTAGGTSEAAIDYQATGGGPHTISVVLDPDNDFDELRENNNEASKDLTVASHWSLKLSATTDQVVADPGDQAVFSVKVTNTGDRRNVIALAISSALPQGWTAGPTKEEVDLAPGTSENILFVVTTSGSSIGGDHVINLTGTSKNKTTNHNTISLTTTIRGDYGLRVKADIFQRAINKEGFALFEMNVTNEGNSPDIIHMTNSSPTNSSWTVVLSEDSMALDPVESRNVTLTMKPPFDAGADETEIITVNVSSQGDPTQRTSLIFTTRIVEPDLTTIDMTFHRMDGQQVDGSTKHLIANRTSFVNVTVTNLLGNIDYMESVLLEILIDDIVSGNAFVTIEGSQTIPVSVQTAFKIGTHMVKACIDANNFIDEPDEDNNCIEKQTSVKSDTSVGPYTVYGTIFWPSGERLANAEIRVMNLRSGEAFDLQTDNQGNYSVDINDLPSGYVEEDKILVRASNGVTEIDRTFLAFSEDLGKQVDIILHPAPYDFFIGPQIKVPTEPGTPALFAMTLTQLGNASNNVSLDLTDAPSSWTVQIQDGSGLVVQNLSVASGQSVDFSVWVTPSEDARADPAGEVLTLTGTSLVKPDKIYSVKLIVEVLQVHEMNATYTGGQAIRGQTAIFNMSIKNMGNGDEVVVPTIGLNPKGWDVTFSVQTLNLSYKATKNMEVEVDLPYNASTGVYDLGVILSFGTNQHLDLTLGVEVMEYDYSFEVVNNDLSERSIAPNSTESFSISVMNEGNIDNTVTIFVSGTPSGWDTELEDLLGAPVTDIDIPVGTSYSLVLKVAAPDETRGTKNVVINISAASLLKPSEQSYTLALLSVYAVDLLPDSNITLSKKTVRTDDNILIALSVRNIGTATAMDATAEFFVDGKPIGQVPIDNLPPNARTNISISWTAKEGSHTLLVKINPLRDLKEMNYENNDIQLNIMVEEKQSDFSLGILAIFIVVMIIITILFLYFKRPDLIHHLIHPREHDDEEDEDEEDDEEDEDEDEDEEEEDEEVLEIEDHHIIEERVVPAKTKRTKRAKKTKKRTVKRVKKKKVSGKKVAKPWTYHEDELEDVDNDSGIMRFG